MEQSKEPDVGTRILAISLAQAVDCDVGSHDALAEVSRLRQRNDAVTKRLRWHPIDEIHQTGLEPPVVQPKDDVRNHRGFASHAAPAFRRFIRRRRYRR